MPPSAPPIGTKPLASSHKYSIPTIKKPIKRPHGWYENEATTFYGDFYPFIPRVLYLPLIRF
jgi:hypothetical protein